MRFVDFFSCRGLTRPPSGEQQQAAPSDGLKGDLVAGWAVVFLLCLPHFPAVSQSLAAQQWFRLLDGVSLSLGLERAAQWLAALAFFDLCACDGLTGPSMVREAGSV